MSFEITQISYEVLEDLGLPLNPDTLSIRTIRVHPHFCPDRGGRLYYAKIIKYIDLILHHCVSLAMYKVDLEKKL